MVGALALFQLATAQPPPLDTIREALAAGDTVRAVALLTPPAGVAPQLDSRTLTDLLLQQWIGRSPGQAEALKAWRAAGRTTRKPADGSDPLLAAAARWVLVQDDLRKLREVVARLTPTAHVVPFECARGGIALECTLRVPPQAG